MNILSKPIICDGLYYNELYRNNSSNHVVIGNLVDGTNFIVGENFIVSIWLLLKEFDGKKTLEQIRDRLEIPEDELFKITDILLSKKIIEVENEENTINMPKSFNEADKFSVKLYERSLENIKVNSFCSNLIINGFKYLIAINAVLFLILSIKFLKHNEASNLIVYNNSYFTSYVLVNLFMVFSFILHEGAHLIVAQRYGAIPEKFVIILYWFFIPMMYLKNKNLYSLSKNELLRVLLAGVLLNLFIFFLFCNLFYLFGIGIFKIIALANLKMAIINLVPLSLTDGYFIFSILLGEPNLRRKSYDIMGSSCKIRKIKKYKKIDLIYTLASFISTLTLFSSEVFCLIGSLQIINGVYLFYCTSIIGLFYGVFYIVWIKKKVLG